MSSIIQSNQVILLPDAASTISAQDSGKIFIIPVLTGNRIISLPAVQAGLRYRFIAGGILAATATLTPTVNGLMNGTLLMNTAGNVSAANVAKTAGNTVVMNAVCAVGDWVDLVSDGTNWYCSGASKIAVSFA